MIAALNIYDYNLLSHSMTSMNFHRYHRNIHFCVNALISHYVYKIVIYAVTSSVMQEGTRTLLIRLKFVMEKTGFNIISKIQYL